VGTAKAVRAVRAREKASMTRAAAWLEELGLGQYAQVFAEQSIDFGVISDLTEVDLEKLGIPLGHRKLMLKAIGALAGASRAADQAPVAPPRPSAERRQLTVLFCDLAGSTELSSRVDPEDLRDIIGAYHRRVAATVARLDGYVAKYMGDGVLVYFGYPQAHEDDAECAVRAGLALVDTVGQIKASEPLRVRVGIATGLVVVGDLFGSGEARERGVVGETPNLAARLQAIAEPGAVVIAQSTRRLIGDLFECRDLGAMALKGFAAPVAMWQVLREGAAPNRFEAFRSMAAWTPLVGRETELALLLDRWQRAKQGAGQVVLISAEPGIGKSRLISALEQERLRAEPPYTRLRYFCSPHHTDSALHPIITQLERAAAFAHEDTPDAKLDKLEMLLAATSTPAEDVTLLADLLSIPTAERYPPPNLTPQRKREKTLEALFGQLAALARQQPLLVVFEDVHWIDPSSRDLLQLVVEQMPRMPALLLITFRPEFQPPSWTGQAHVKTLALRRLDRGEGAVMVERIARDKALPGEIVDQIVAKTDGVPLFVEELTKMILESGLLKEQEDRYELTGPLPPLAIPATLHDSLTARLDRLSTIKNLAQLGATLGREFSYALLKAVSPWDEQTLCRGLGQLVEADFLYQQGLPPQATYAFRHALIQDAAYQLLLKSTRQQYHQRIAQVLEAQFPDIVETQPESLARHYTEAGLAAQAVCYWQRAGERSNARSAHVEAVVHCAKGLEVLQSLPETPERAQHELLLQTTLGPALMATKGYVAPEVEASYNRALTLCRQVGETPRLFVTLMGLWQFYLVRARHKTARELGDRLLNLAENVGDPALLVQAHRALGESYQNLGELALAQKHLAQGSALYDRRQRSHAVLNDPGVFCLSFASWVLWLLGYPEQALQRSRAALTLARELSHPHTLAAVLFFAGILHQLRRERHLTRERAEAAIALAREQGLPFWVPFANIERGWALATQGQWDEGIAHIQQGLVAHQAIDAEIARPVYLAMLTEAYVAAGQVQAGLRVLAEALAHVDRTEERYYEAELYRLKGDLLLRQRVPDTSQAEACFERALVVARRQQARSWELRAATSLAHLLWSQNQRAAAHNLLAPIYAWFTEGFDTADLREAKALMEALTLRTRGHRAEGYGTLEKCRNVRANFTK
jgi:predicted ATPase/class 3 adenylate cyclase